MQSYAEDTIVSMPCAVNLRDDMCSIQIASLGSDLCQCGGTLATAEATGKVKVKAAFCGKKREQKVH